MTNRQINKIIALVAGWQHKRQAPTKHGKKLPWTADYWRHPWHQPHWKREETPRNYTSDLNACQEGIGTLSGPGYKAFCCFLLEIVGNTDEAMTATAVKKIQCGNAANKKNKGKMKSKALVEYSGKTNKEKALESFSREVAIATIGKWGYHTAAIIVEQT